TQAESGLSSAPRPRMWQVGSHMRGRGAHPAPTRVAHLFEFYPHALLERIEAPVRDGAGVEEDVLALRLRPDEAEPAIADDADYRSCGHLPRSPTSPRAQPRAALPGSRRKRRAGRDDSERRGAAHQPREARGGRQRPRPTEQRQRLVPRGAEREQARAGPAEMEARPGALTERVLQRGQPRVERAGGG